jgi:hypothetical protein
MKISHSLEIGSTSDRFFFWLEDPNRAVRRMTSVTNTEIIETTPDMAGADIRFKGFTRVLRVILGPVFKKKIVSQAKTGFARLKELCEGGADLR